MENLMDAISDFIGKVIFLTLAGVFIALLAGEIKMAALKKASHGSSKLSGFTQRMTKTKTF